ncbi:class I SAM-dependent methyltransferase [Bacillus sp. mrc49]|uniref:class I SAM-dependent methyltransferase n=1 Tax=Bacillus sp. mrc49 TaxID=2054913 RepID=UPI000C27D4E3|nr:class I SAM-dependent methyltransferase [Bacillus sp. mrc49]PJN91580.1 16S rRNA (cytosine(1402)-N(4))-methyltransferase [Bacillus sp. mrc49]
MKLDRILPYARILLEKTVQPGDIAVDGTMGNGIDTAFLAGLTGETGHVYSFDIQKEALQNTSVKLENEGLSNQCTLIHDGHQHLSNYIRKEHAGKITGAIFNLGYLPGGDKSIITEADTTTAAIEQLFGLLAPEGIIILVIYHGHPGGSQERDALMDYVQNFPQQKAHILKYGFINQANNPPFIIAIEKR